MTNRLLLCTGCKKRFDREGMVKLPAGWFHSTGCAVSYAQAKQLRDRERAQNKARKEFRAETRRRKTALRKSDLKIRKAAAKKACHAYIRERDKNQSCICCHRPLGDKYDAGHWLESGNHPFIRYHEDNINAQTVYCNQYKGGDSGDYEANLRKKIGDARVDWLKDNRSKPIKRAAEDYIEIENYYKQKLMEIQK